MNELSLEAKPENLGDVLAFLADALACAPCPDKTRRQIAIAAEEIFVNIANYAYRPDNGLATVRVSVNQDAVIEFEDTGAPYNPLEKETPNTAAKLEEREAGGLGIFMVKQLMDDVSYRREDRKNILVMRKRLAE